jgi:hypothetical protein
MNKHTDEVFKIFGMLCLSLALSCYTLFVDKHLWDLVFVPMGAPHISYLRLFVIELVLRIYTYRSKINREEDKSTDYSYMLSRAFGFAVFTTLVWAILAHCG